MNTEKINTHAQVTELMDELGVEKVRYLPGTSERQMLDQAYENLKEVSWKIVTADITAWIADIEASSKGLQKLSTEMTKASEALKKIAKRIKAVAKTLGVLAEIVVKAGSVGIL